MTLQLPVLSLVVQSLNKYIIRTVRGDHDQNEGFCSRIDGYDTIWVVLSLKSPKELQVRQVVDVNSGPHHHYDLVPAQFNV